MTDDFIRQTSTWIEEISRQRQKILQYPSSTNKIIYINFDETPIYFDMSKNFTYAKKGDREVILKTTTGTK